MDAAVFRVHAEVERRHWWFAGRRRILRALLERFVPPDPAHTIADIGCGVGATAPAFRAGYRYVGFDPSPDAIGAARATYPGVEFRIGSAAEAAATLAGSSAALLNDVIEHVPDDRALLSQVVEPLKAGAYLLVTVPAGMELWSPHDVALGHFRRYDTASFQAVWEGLPVETCFLSHFNSRLYFPVRAVRALTARLDRAAGPAGTDLAIPPAPLNSALEALFAGEATRLARGIGKSGPVYRRGVSLISVLRRT
jgi:SAM-dependent methyltransferase